jgi:hypothetical protein
MCKPNLMLKSVLCVSLVLTGAALILAAPASAPGAHPEPRVVSDSWVLDLDYQQPRPIAVENADGEAQWYWFMPYKVTNDTGDTRLFIPEVTIYENTGRIIEANENVPERVFEKVKDRLDNPLLKSPLNIVGELLEGEDYAKESVIIWSASEEDVDSFRLFFSGLSGETANVDNPRTGNAVLMRRTLMLEYQTPGNYDTPQNQPIEQINEEWVMR